MARQRWLPTVAHYVSELVHKSNRLPVPSGQLTQGPLCLASGASPGTAQQGLRAAHHQVATELTVDNGCQQVHQKQASCERKKNTPPT